jgi:outer membrane biosynthesis protein TonB
LFPFIKEMILGEKSIKEALKTNKMRVFLIGLILLSFFLNMFTLPKLVKISADYVILDRKYKELEDKYKGINQSSHPVVKPSTVPKETPKQEKPQVEQEVTQTVTPVQPPPDEPVPTPMEEQPAPADVPPVPRRTPHRQKPEPVHKPHPNQNNNSPEATRRYKEWKKTLDDIRAKQAEIQRENQRREDAFYSSPDFMHDPYRH